MGKLFDNYNIILLAVNKSKLKFPHAASNHEHGGRETWKIHAKSQFLIPQKREIILHAFL